MTGRRTIFTATRGIIYKGYDKLLLKTMKNIEENITISATIEMKSFSSPTNKPPWKLKKKIFIIKSLLGSE